MKTILSNTLCLLLLFLCCLRVQAQTLSTSDVIDENAIAIHQVNGSIITYAFEDKPVISYSGEELVISTRSITVQYPLAYLRKLTLEGDWNRVDGIDQATIPGTEFSFSDDGANVCGEQPGTPFYVFDTRGMMLHQGIIDANGKADIRMTNLPKGIYIIKTQSTSFKIKK